MRRSITTADLPTICLQVTDGTHDSPRLQPSGVPFIKGKHISSGRIDFDACDFISEEDHVKCIKRVKPQPDDVLFANIGSVGDVARVTDEREFSIKNVALFRPDARKVDPTYFYYLVTSPSFRGVFLSARSGAAQPFISLDAFRSHRFPFNADKGEQQTIGSILSAYDDLIENNRRRMWLLEDAARKLYREWFVRLRFPGHEHTRIINGVPEGWESGAIADFFDTTSGGTPSRANPDFYTGDINWVKTQELNDDFIFETEERITEDALARSSAKLFPVDTLLVSIYGGSNIGRTGILAEPAATNQACCALFPKDPRANYMYGSLYFREQREHLIALAQGAAQTNISQQVIRSLPMRMPTPTLMTAFIESLSPAFEQLKVLKRQNERLRAARDLLLPRLMGGEIAV